jgi:membrane associated rhomboid family serine protease
MTRPSEPFLNLPTVIAAIVLAFGLVHAVRELMLTPEEDVGVLLWFAFIPARFGGLPGFTANFPGGLGADVWTFVTYAFLHGDLTHLGINVLWLLPFGTAVARRFSTTRFLAFFAATAAVGAAVHLASRGPEFLPMIGASAAISGFMAAAIRFVFQIGGPLGVFRRTDTAAYLVPAAPLLQTLRDPRILAFLVVWFGLNILFGVGAVGAFGVDQAVAWQAHIGGFVAGLLLFPLFDPVPLARRID